MIPVPGNPVHAISLLPGDDVRLEPHDVSGTDLEGRHWQEHIGRSEPCVHVERVRWPEDLGADLVELYWWLGSATGVTVYGPTSLIPLLRRVA
jgi:hypothetical protein